MEISFGDKKLEKLANDYRKCQIHNAQTLEDVRYLPGHYHELKEDRKGQWACDLDQPYRLIFDPRKNPYQLISLVNISGLKLKVLK